MFNYARIGSVDGEVAGAELRAYIADVNDPSKLAVGPIGLPTDFYGPYWVLAAGPGTRCPPPLPSLPRAPRTGSTWP